MTEKDKVINAFESWYKELKVHTSSRGPARGTIGAALVVLDRLKSEFELDLAFHRASGQSQIRGVSAASVQRVLSKFGENRPFLREGGRTNRGGPGDIAKMLSSLEESGLSQLSKKERAAIIQDLQAFLVDRVRDYHNRQRLNLVYDPAQSFWHSIHSLLALAQEECKEGPVAQYLVGAKLEQRFPQLQIENLSYSTADDQLGRPGDFFVGDTAFHVTVAPASPLLKKMKQNIDAGYGAFLIVPDRCLAAAQQMAELECPRQVCVGSIETFVGQNIQEISFFKKNRLQHEFRRLLEIYNRRVDAIEADKSMLIEIPRNL